MPPAGWYRDRSDPSLARYWDGSHWSELTRPTPPPADTVPPEATPLGRPPRTGPRSRSALLGHLFRQTPFWVVVCLGLLALVGVVLVELGKPSPTVAGASAPKAQIPSTTLAAPTTTTTAPAIPVAPQPSAEQAADALVANWAAGNRPVALSVATQGAVDTLFAVNYTSGLAIDRGCSDGAAPVTCTFGPPGGGNPDDPIYSLTVAQAPNGWYVSSVTVES